MCNLHPARDQWSGYISQLNHTDQILKEDQTRVGWCWCSLSKLEVSKATKQKLQYCFYTLKSNMQWSFKRFVGVQLFLQTLWLMGLWAGRTNRYLCRWTHRSCVSSPLKLLCVRLASFCWKPELSAETWLPQLNPSIEQSDLHDPETESLPRDNASYYNKKSRASLYLYFPLLVSIMPQCQGAY